MTIDKFLNEKYSKVYDLTMYSVVFSLQSLTLVNWRINRQQTTAISAIAIAMAIENFREKREKRKRCQVFDLTVDTVENEKQEARSFLTSGISD